MQWCLNQLYQQIFKATQLWRQNEDRKEQIKRHKFSLLCKEHIIISEADQGDRTQTQSQKMDLTTESMCSGNEQHSLQHFLSRHTLILNRSPKDRIIPEQTTAEVWDKYNIHNYLPQYVCMNSYKYSIHIYIYIYSHKYIQVHVSKINLFTLMHLTVQCSTQCHLNHSNQYFSLTPTTHWKHRVK